jgi:4-diphosphocytidyl-2-C-methyl-D-erythritol kinase
MTDSDMSWWPAPAKLNLFLHVLGRRTDGYHDIQTLFRLLDWGDDIGIRSLDRPGISRLPVSYDVVEREDLVVRAAQMLQAETGVSAGAEIAVHKRVPPGSGLGGGSSDAATVLLVLNTLWGCNLSLDDLARLGRPLGADIPVFIRGNSALAGGIGEKLQPVGLGKRHYVLVFPDFSVRTRDIFTDPDLNRSSKALNPDDALAGAGINDCEPVVRNRFSAFEEIMRNLEKWGRPRMTGTGSGIFLPMNDKKTAMSAAQSMKTLYNVRAVQGVDRSPLHEEAGLLIE